MKFIYGFDSLGDKLTSPSPIGLFIIRPILYDQSSSSGPVVTPATFEDFDRYSLYVREEDGLDRHLSDWDTISEAIAVAEESNAY